MGFVSNLSCMFQDVHCSDNGVELVALANMSIIRLTSNILHTTNIRQVPRPMMTNGDLARIINSDEIQSVVKPAKSAGPKHGPLKKNPLRNLGAMIKLNPYAKVLFASNIPAFRLVHR